MARFFIAVVLMLAASVAALSVSSDTCTDLITSSTGFVTSARFPNSTTSSPHTAAGTISPIFLSTSFPSITALPTTTSACIAAVSDATAVGDVGNWSITSVSEVFPVPTNLHLQYANYAVDAGFVAAHQIKVKTDDYQYIVNRTSDDFGYYEFKCQELCDAGCSSWFVSSETTDGVTSTLSCAQYDALMNSSVLVPAGNSDGFGIAFDQAIGTRNLCNSTTNSSSVTSALWTNATVTTVGASTNSSIATPTVPVNATTTAITTTPVCTPPGGKTQIVPPPAIGRPGEGWYIDDDFIAAHRFYYLTSDDFVSVEDFFAKCLGTCVPVENQICDSFYMAYGVPDYANAWPHIGDVTTQWLCQIFNAPLNTSLYRPATLPGSWRYSIGVNNLC